MTCYHPLTAFQTDDGEIVFAERGSIKRKLELPCGQCVGCRLERSRVWAMRCVHESQMHEYSSFVTLTYKEEECPGSLHYPHFQKFMKRVRRKFGPTRFFMCGEYGETLRRPHYHALLFGVFFRDRVLHSSRDGLHLYRSEELSRLWQHGFSTVGDVTFESAAYTARYIMKKVTGDAAVDHYRAVHIRTGEVLDLVPEFCHMSLKPGIGASWFSRYCGDVFNYGRDSVRIGNIECAPPRYYKKLLGDMDGRLLMDVEYGRQLRAAEGLEDRTPDRLAVREKVAKARLKFFKRELA